MVYNGKVHNGVVVLDNGSKLAEGTVVRVEPVEESDEGRHSSDSLFTWGRRAVRTGQPDLATNLDHYLYGHPKVSDEQP